MTRLSDLWREQQHATFPTDCLGVWVGGTTLLQLDVATAICLTSCLRTDGVPRALPESQRCQLQRSHELLLQALELPLSVQGREYFSRLELLASAVLASR